MSGVASGSVGFDIKIAAGVMVTHGKGPCALRDSKNLSDAMYEDLTGVTSATYRQILITTGPSWVDTR